MKRLAVSSFKATVAYTLADDGVQYRYLAMRLQLSRQIFRYVFAKCLKIAYEAMAKNSLVVRMYRSRKYGNFAVICAKPTKRVKEQSSAFVYVEAVGIVFGKRLRTVTEWLSKLERHFSSPDVDEVILTGRERAVLVNHEVVEALAALRGRISRIEARAVQALQEYVSFLLLVDSVGDGGWLKS